MEIQKSAATKAQNPQHRSCSPASKSCLSLVVRAKSLSLPHQARPLFGNFRRATAHGIWTFKSRKVLTVLFGSDQIFLQLICSSIFLLSSLVDIIKNKFISWYFLIDKIYSKFLKFSP